MAWRTDDVRVEVAYGSAALKDEPGPRDVEQVTPMCVLHGDAKGATTTQQL